MVLDTLLALKKAGRLEIGEILFAVMRKFAPPGRTRPLPHAGVLNVSFILCFHLLSVYTFSVRISSSQWKCGVNTPILWRPMGHLFL